MSTAQDKAACQRLKKRFPDVDTKQFALVPKRWRCPASLRRRAGRIPGVWWRWESMESGLPLPKNAPRPRARTWLATGAPAEPGSLAPGSPSWFTRWKPPSLKQMLLTQGIYVTPADSFEAKFRDVFTDVKIKHTMSAEFCQWLAGANIGYWPEQRTFALWCATTESLTDYSSQMPPIALSICNPWSAISYRSMSISRCGKYSSS